MHWLVRLRVKDNRRHHGLVHIRMGGRNIRLRRIDRFRVYLYAAIDSAYRVRYSHHYAMRLPIRINAYSYVHTPSRSNDDYRSMRLLLNNTKSYD